MFGLIALNEQYKTKQNNGGALFNLGHIRVESEGSDFRGNYAEVFTKKSTFRSDNLFLRTSQMTSLYIYMLPRAHGGT